MRRVFLGLERPAVEAAADLLIQQHRVGQWLDLSRIVIALPGRRAGRRLWQRLAEKSADQGLHFLPPQIVPVGRLPDTFYSPRLPLATDWLQEWAWTRALSQLTADDRARAIGSSPDTPGEAAEPDHPRLAQQARQILHRYAALAAGGWRISDVLARIERASGHPDHPFWQALSRLEEHYLKWLNQHGLTDREQSRLQAVREGSCRLSGPLYLLATVELHRIAKTMVKQSDQPVTSLVFGPVDWSDRFDEFGCILPDAWIDAELPLTVDQWSVVRAPADAANLAASWIRQQADETDCKSAPDVTVGVADESLVPYLQRAIGTSGYQSRWAAGYPFTNTVAWRLLAQIRDCVAWDGVRELMQLSRHPHIDDWLLRGGVAPSFLPQLDHYLESAVPAHEISPPPKSPHLQTWSRMMAQLRSTFRSGPGSLVEHARLLSSLFADVLTGATFDGEHESERAATLAYELLASELTNIAAGPAELAPSWTLAESIDWIMDRMAQSSVPMEAKPQAVEMLGWLELLLDDAPRLIVAGMNEGCVPARVAADPFLSADMREEFHVDQEAQRFARDAYVLSTLVHTRQTLHLIVPRVGVNDDPLLPSRLLFQADPLEIPHRWHRVLEETSDLDHLDSEDADVPTRSAFGVPPLDRYQRKINALRVTDFRSYLACPYRFFLERILRLRSVEHDRVEMDAASFGNLAHSVLARFGTSEVRNSKDADEISDYLDKALQEFVLQQFGPDPRAAVRLQVAHLQRRLRVLAEHQAQRAADGWRIAHVEQPASNTPVPFTVDGTAFGLIGRIDRIDLHEPSEDIFILDYKTSEQEKEPMKSHRKADGTWIDLQLPLYRHIAASMGLRGNIRLGYFNLCKSAASSGVKEATWADADLASADEAAKSVIRRIRRGIFGPPADPPPPFSQTWSWICMENLREGHDP